MEIKNNEIFSNNELPKTWEEFCEINNIAQGESFIGLGSEVSLMKGTYRRDSVSDKNICTSGPEAAAFLALIQLRQLRKAYVKDWEPNWDNNDPKYCIICDSNQFDVVNFYHISGPLSFSTEELASQFLTNFKDLLEIAKPLL